MLNSFFRLNHYKYYQENKERLLKKACERHQNLSEEQKK